MSSTNFLPATDAGKLAAEYADKMKRGRMTPLASHKAAFLDGYIAGMSFARQVQQDGLNAISAGLDTGLVSDLASAQDSDIIPTA